MDSNTLKELRGRIDALDGEIIALLRDRVALSNAIMSAKVPGQIIDVGREQEIVQRYAEGLAAVSTTAKIRRLVSAVIQVSSVYPEA